MSADSAKINYTVGDKVSHEKFGIGVIISVKPMSNDALLEIAFDDYGTKKIMSNYSMMKKL